MIFVLLISLIIQAFFCYKFFRNSNLYYILLLQPVILILNVGLVTILDGLIFLKVEHKVFELLIVVVLELLLVYIFKLHVTFKSKIIISRKDFFTLVLISIILFSIFYNLLSPESLYLSSGDGIAHLSVLNDVKVYKQDLLRHVYLDQGQNVLMSGNFYPRASHYLGNIINVRNSSYSIVYFYLMNISFSILWPLALYQAIRIYTNSKFSISILSFLLTLNIFPLGLIYTANLSSIYGTLAAVGGFILLKNLIFRKVISKFIIYFAFLSVIALYHPSGVFTFAFLIILDYFMSFKRIEFKASIFYILVIFFVLVSFFVLQQFSIEIAMYFSSLPNNYLSVNNFIPRLLDLDVIEPYIVQYYNLSFTTSLLMLPNFLLVISMIFFTKYKKIYLFYSLLIYLIIITSTFFAGFERPLSYLSLLGIMYYQSPIRIAHLGILVFMYIIVSYFISRKDLHSLNNRNYLIFQFSMIFYLFSWSYFSLASSF